MTTTTSVLQDRKRQAIQAVVVAVTVDLFARQGYGQTTVEQIAHASGMSSRTFFRYFASKDDVLVQVLSSGGRAVMDALERRAPSEEPWVALRRSFDSFIEQMEDGHVAAGLARLIYTTPELHASYLQRQAAWREHLSDALERRLSSSTSPDHRKLVAHSLVGAAMACFESARSVWLAEERKQPLGVLLDAAMNAVAPLTDSAQSLKPRPRRSP